MLLFLDIKRPGIRSEYRAFSDCLAQSKIAPKSILCHFGGKVLLFLFMPSEKTPPNLTV